MASDNASPEWKDPLHPLSDTKENLSGSNNVHLDYISNCDQKTHHEKLSCESPQIARDQPKFKPFKPASSTNSSISVMHENSASLVDKISPPVDIKDVTGNGIGVVGVSYLLTCRSLILSLIIVILIYRWPV